ncbi:MAG: alanine racemase [Clostridia bacterium]|nr:alanine racemase [Clostridia bacterium]
MFCAEDYKKRVWAEIDLDALQHNFTAIKGLLRPETKILAVVKANAYGHGAVPCARALLSYGADYLGVATIEEALELRHANIFAPILVLGYAPAQEAEVLISNNITPTVYTMEFAKALSAAAVKLDKDCRIHLKINTGMERLGFEPEQIDDIKKVCSLPGLTAEGIFTHLACADSEDSSGVHLQYEAFIKLTNQLADGGICIPLRHILNSAGIFDFPEYQLEMVRPGIVLYGYYPSNYIHTERAVLRPVMTLKTRVIHLHKAPAGAKVSYGWTYTAKAPITIATIPIGYADGYNRHLSGKGKMLAKGQTVPILGKICMDQCMIDVSSVNTVNVGDEIIIIGKQGDEQITAQDLADQIDTISYEILCATGKRVPRLYEKAAL